MCVTAVQESQDSIQAVRRPFFHPLRRFRRQRAQHARIHPPFRGSAGLVLRKCVRARPGFQLLQGISNPRRDGRWWRSYGN